MGLFDKIFGSAPKPKGDYEGVFRVLTGYTPTFTSFGGSIYEQGLVRAAINARATHISKLAVEMHGSARPALQRKMAHGPNEWSTWGQFLYRLSTILDVHNSAFIVPVYDKYGEPSGVYPVLPHRCTFVQYNDVPYLRYEFSFGQHAAVELAYCGIMTKFQYQDDFLGETNHALLPTMDLLHIQDQGIEEGVKSAATYRFMARVGNFSKSEDLAKERKRFTAENFAKDGGGILLFPNTYTDIKQYIDDALKGAKEANERIAGIEQQCNALVEEARQKQMEILREAAAAREQMMKEARERADAETVKIVADAKKEIERQKEEALNALRDDAARLAVAVAEKILRGELSSPQSQEKYIARLVDETKNELDSINGK